MWSGAPTPDYTVPMRRAAWGTELCFPGTCDYTPPDRRWIWLKDRSYIADPDVLWLNFWVQVTLSTRQIERLLTVRTEWSKK